MWEALDKRLYGKRGRAAAAWELDLARLRKKKEGKGKEGGASQHEQGASATTTTAKDFLRIFQKGKSPAEIREAAEAVARDPAFPDAAREILKGLYEMEGAVVPGRKEKKGRELKGKGKEKEKEKEKECGDSGTEEVLGEKLEKLRSLVEEVKQLRGEEYVRW